MTHTVLHAPAFEDNYIWLIAGCAPAAADKRPCIIVDPGDDDPVLRLMEKENLQPVAILCTHHHGDHVLGVADIAGRHGIPVYGPRDENIPAVTHAVADGEVLEFPALELALHVLAVPGHTRGHVAYYASGMLFCGDTLFSAGCGRLFEGTHAQLHHSLSRLAALPDDTAVYCGHEYTLANLRFAAAVEPDNSHIGRHLSRVAALREQNRPSLPSSIGLEKRINPFLRVDQPTVVQQTRIHAGRELGTPLEVFTELRCWKDRFRG